MDCNAAFLELARAAAACTRCPELAERSAVLGPGNGALKPLAMFVAEAPGRQGADRTRTPLVGDQSGTNFDKLITAVGITRDNIFITNAALCNPRSASGANRKPRQTEIANCSDFLLRQLMLLDPPVVVTLGSVALAALKRIEYHDLTLGKSVGLSFNWFGRLLMPVFHPSPLVMASHRRMHQQLADYSLIARALDLVQRKI